MKALLLGSSNSRNAGGIFHTMQALGHQLHVQGTDVHYLLHDDEHSAADRASYAPLPLHTYAIKGPRNLAYSADLPQQLRAIQPEVVHTQGIWMYFSAVNSRYCARTQTPYLVSPHGMLDPWQLRQSLGKDLKKQLALALYERRHLRQAACLHALNTSEHEAIRSFGARNPVAVMPNGVDLPAPAQGPAVPPWANSEDRNTLLFLSRVHPKKGLDELLDGWALTQPKRHNWQLVVAGPPKDAAYGAALRAQAQRLGVADTVQFIGGQFGERKATCYRAAQAFVLPSFSEGLPMAVLEAWSYGLPVVMSEFCNLPEGFTSGAALPVAPTPDSIAASLKQLFALPAAKRQQVGQRGYELVRERFTWAKVAADTLGLYRWVLGKGARPSFVHTL